MHGSRTVDGLLALLLALGLTAIIAPTAQANGGPQVSPMIGVAARADTDRDARSEAQAVRSAKNVFRLVNQKRFHKAAKFIWSRGDRREFKSFRKRGFTWGGVIECWWDSEERAYQCAATLLKKKRVMGSTWLLTNGRDHVRFWQVWKADVVLGE